MGLKKTDDHWAFLEEFEAPMWVDLTLEAKANDQDIDHKWFYISHPFHQCSFRQLKSAFSHCSEESENQDFQLYGPSSPKLPSSVSRSRGKHQRSRKWGKEHVGFSLNKQHPVKSLNGKTSWVDSGSSQEIKSKPSYGSSNGTHNSKTSSGCSRSARSSRPNYTIPISSSGESKGHVSSEAIKESQSNSTTSTITFESTRQQPQKFSEASSGLFGHTSELLSVMKITLRKSCTTRQASRVEISKSRHSEVHKSSAGKSSVGSSSNPDYIVKNGTAIATQTRDRTPDSRNVMQTSQTAVNRGRASTASKASNVQVDHRTNNSRQESKRIFAKPTKDASKLKVVCETEKRKALVPHRVNEQDPLTAAAKARSKVGLGVSNRVACAGKENARGKLPGISQKSSGRDVTARDMVRTGKMQNISRKGDKTGLPGSKGKISGQIEGKTSMKLHQKVFRP